MIWIGIDPGQKGALAIIGWDAALSEFDAWLPAFLEQLGDEDVLFIDRMDGSAKMVVSRNIKRVEWEVKDNGVKYTAYGMDGMGKEKIMFFGYACKRGR